MKSVHSMLALLVFGLVFASAAQAANLPDQCYQDAMGYANNRVLDLSTRIVRATRLGEPEATEASDSDGMAKVTLEMRADYENGDSQDYRVTVPVQVDDEGMCSVAGQASIRKLN